MPPVSALLESADRPSAVPPPPPVPEARSLELQALDARERELRSDIAQLQDRAARLDRQARAIQAGLTDLPNELSEREQEELRAMRARPERRISRFSGSNSPTLLTRLSRSGQVPRSRFGPSPPSVPSQGLPQARDAPGARTSTLPTPPHDVSENPESLFLPEQSESTGLPASRPSHPLSNSWRPESPINGLGDRNRSPTPGDVWEIMRTTITPDATLPSAESSFTSAAASHSFSSHRTTFTEPEQLSSSESSHRTSGDGNQSDSVSSIDPDDLVCNDEEREATASFAQDMYFHERSYPEGMERIGRHREAHEIEGNRFLLSGEPECVEIGFRLINEALDNPEGRERMFQLSQSRPGPDARDFEAWIFANRPGRRRTRRAHITEDDPPTPHPERNVSSAVAAVRESRAQLDDYFRRYNPGMLNAPRGSSDPRTAAREARAQLDDYLRRFNPDMLEARNRGTAATSPPPRYEPLASHPDVNTFTSRDAPEPHPVSPPSTRSERDVADALLSGDEQDLHAMQRVVQRLARRDDVPDEWWMSMGLNLSRTRARSRSPRRQNPRSADGSRMRSGRIERSSESSRL